MYQAITANKIKSVLLIVIFVLIILVAAYVYMEASGMSPSIMTIVVIGIILFAVISYYASPNITLAISGAQKITRKSHQGLYRIVDTLAVTLGIPTPEIYVIPDSAMNAFATGTKPEKSVIAVTTGLLEKLERTELEGVMAHEMSHIKNYDMRLMTLVVIFAGILTMLSDFFLRFNYWGGSRRSSRSGGKLQGIFLLIGIVLALLAPLIALLIRMAISRKREYLADATAALMTRYPEGLARALEKLSQDTKILNTANKATAHLFIVNPLKSSWVNNMFATHPPIEDRIRALRSMIG